MGERFCRDEPLEFGPESLAKLAEAATRRTMASETFRLLADDDTATAAGEMTRCVSELESFARGTNQGDSSDWHRAYARYEQARDQYIVDARKNLKVTDHRSVS